MQVVLDDRPCGINADSIAQAIDAASTLARDGGRLVVEVHVDGFKLSDEELGEPARLAATAGEVRMISVEPRKMVHQTFAEIMDLFPRIDTAQRLAAELLQADRTQEAMAQIGEALSFWLVVQEGILKGSQLLGLPLDDIATSDITMPEAIKQLNGHLCNMRDALKNHDPVGLADTMLYELPDVVATWRGLVAKLSDAVNPGE